MTIAVVVGVGAVSGLGSALAMRFAKEGLKVYLGGRSAEKLAAVADEITKNGGCAVPYVVDATDEASVVKLFETIESNENAPLTLVACNVDSNQRAPLLDTSSEMFKQMWLQNAYAGFLVGREAVRLMTKQAQQGSLFFTGASASLRTRPPFTAFSCAKTALRALAQGMAREFGSQGIHVVHVVIDGVIDGERAHRDFAPLVAQKEKDGLLNLEAIAQTYWLLHCQDKTTWTHELDLRPYKEPF